MMKMKKVLGKKTGNIFKKASSRYLNSRQTKWWVGLLDLVLLVTTLLLPYGEAEVLLIFIFFFLTLGAFFWDLRAFVLRSSFWVAVTTVTVLISLRFDEHFNEEIIEILVLSGILVSVYIIASQRKQAEEALRDVNLGLEKRVAERTADLTRSNQELAQEIIEHKRTEATLRKSEGQLRKLSRAVEQSPSIVVITNTQGKIEYVNPKFSQATGYTLEEVLGKNPRILKSGKTSPEEYKRLWQIITSGDKWQGQLHNRKKNGELYWAFASISPIRDPSGNITHFLAVQEDITERKLAEESLQKSEANLKAIFDNTLQAFVLVDRNFVVQAFNKTAGAGIEIALGEEIKEGDSAYDFVPEKELDQFKKDFKKVLSGGSVSREQYVKLGPIEKWFEFNYNPVFVDNGSVIGICFSAIDIDERKKAATALAESEARLLAEMQSALAVTRALVSEMNVNNLLDFIMAQAEDLTKPDGVAVLLLSDDGQRLEVASSGESRSRIEVGAQVPMQGSLAGLAVSSRQVQISNRALDDERAASICVLLQPVKVHSLLCAPLEVQGKSLGVLLIWSYDRRQVFTEHNSQLISLFADQAALALQNAHLHARDRQLAVEQERHRLARELHDTVTQSLYSISMAAQTSLKLLNQAGADDKIQRPLNHISTLAKNSLTEMREQIYHLTPTSLAEKGLIEALGQHCNLLRNHYDLVIEFIAGSGLSFSMDQQKALYYIAREALWNVIKYADAMHINVLLTGEDDQIVLSVIDNGIGFDSLAGIRNETMGLRNMAERAKQLGGTFEVQSKPGQGSRVIARIPKMGWSTNIDKVNFSQARDQDTG